MNDERSYFNQLFDRLIDRWWGKVLCGCFFFAICGLMYYNFSQVENGDRDAIVGPQIIVGAYKLFGKWPPIAVFALLGLGSAMWGFVHLLRGRE